VPCRLLISPNGHRVLASALSYFALILAAGPGVAVQPFARESPVETFKLEDFEGYPVQSFPEKWRRRSEAARKIYRVESENGNRFLHAYADRQAVQIGLEQLFDPAKFRRLSWRWRVHALPQGADERMAAKHDAAAQVYVVFDNQYLPRVIKYIWSAGLPTGLGFTNPLYGRGRVIVLRSGSSGKGEWHRETVDFYHDYKRLFGEEPGQVQGIGILSSSDSTESVVSADYDDFILLR
jgi:hypothetical protein